MKQYTDIKHKSTLCLFNGIIIGWIGHEDTTVKIEGATNLPEINDQWPQRHGPLSKCHKHITFMVYTVIPSLIFAVTFLAMSGKDPIFFEREPCCSMVTTGWYRSQNKVTDTLLGRAENVLTSIQTNINNED
jgi:hypothetical protein